MSTPSVPKASTHRRQRKSTVIGTVLGLNFAGIAAVVVGLAIWARSHANDGGEDWSGLVAVIVGATLVGLLLVSLTIGVAVAANRINSPAWSVPATNLDAIRGGLRSAAWGLIALVPVPLFLLLSWAKSLIE